MIDKITMLTFGLFEVALGVWTVLYRKKIYYYMHDIYVKRRLQYDNQSQDKDVIHKILNFLVLRPQGHSIYYHNDKKSSIIFTLFASLIIIQGFFLILSSLNIQ